MDSTDMAILWTAGCFFDKWLYYLTISTSSPLSSVVAGKVLSVIIFVTWFSYSLVSSSVRTETKSGKSIKYYFITESFMLRFIQGPSAANTFKVELSNRSLSLPKTAHFLYTVVDAVKKHTTVGSSGFFTDFLSSLPTAYRVSIYQKWMINKNV